MQAEFDASVSRLVSAALQKTRAGRMVWEKADGPDTYMFVGPSWSLIVGPEKWGHLGGPSLQLLDGHGQVVRVIEPVTAGASLAMSTAGWSADEMQASLELPELHEAAKASARGVNLVVEESLRDIENL